MTFHREGVATLVVALIFSAIVSYSAYTWLPAVLFYLLAFGCIVLLGLVINFFRMPSREIGSTQMEEILCPSDGKVVVIEKVQETEWFKDERIQISIFMSPLNVHAQWSPMAGKVLAALYHPGKYLVAWHPKSSTLNERTTFAQSTPYGTVVWRQIAGAVARRIRWFVEEGQQIEHAQECGFILFGSRIDIYLPLGSEVLVEPGDRVVARGTVMARLPEVH